MEALLEGFLPSPCEGGNPAGDWRTLQLSCTVFLALWFINQLLWRSLRWKGTAFANAVSCGMSLFHGSTTTVLSARALLSRPRSTPVDAVNTAQENWLMQLSMGYFILDSLHIMLYRLDPLFLCHHFQTLTYMAWSSLLGRGGWSVMLLMCSGEMTSPLQNAWMLSKYGAENGSPVGAAVHQVMSPLFAYCFAVARTLVGPAVFAVVVSGLRDSRTLPRSAVAAWSFMAVVGVVGSWLWVLKLLQGLRKAKARPVSTRASSKKRT